MLVLFIFATRRSWRVPARGPTCNFWAPQSRLAGLDRWFPKAVNPRKLWQALQKYLGSLAAAI
jgi:hypothetical protein